MPDRYALDPDLLTPRDLRRARANASVREAASGRDPMEMMNDPLDKTVLTMWCLLSRSDPDLTWDQAEDTQFAAFDAPEPPPPPTAGPTSPGPGDAEQNGSASKPRRRSAVSSATADPTTT